MAIREDLVASAVTFLQDPSVASSPVESRVAFLQSKNLTQEEIDVSLARAGGDANTPAPQSNYSNYAPQQQMVTQQPPNYGPYQQQWHQPIAPEVPKRDWRDWFIMATVMGGVSYGLYVVAKRYIVPLVAPPTPPQLEADKAAIDESFEKAFALLDQLAKDTDTLKGAEEARTECLDTALAEVENVILELKTGAKRREDETRRISDEVRGLKDLIPKAMEGQKESTDLRLKELNTELKSLKTLMGQRMNPTSTGSVPSYNRMPANVSSPQPTSIQTSIISGGGASPSTENGPKPASVSTPSGVESFAQLQGRSGSPFNTGALPGRAAIPAWQMAIANKSSSPVNANGTSNAQEGASSSGN